MVALALALALAPHSRRRTLRCPDDDGYGKLGSSSRRHLAVIISMVSRVGMRPPCSGSLIVRVGLRPLPPNHSSPLRNYKAVCAAEGRYAVRLRSYQHTHAHVCVQ